MACELAHEVCRLAAELAPPMPPTAVVITHNNGDAESGLLLLVLRPRRHASTLVVDAYQGTCESGEGSLSGRPRVQGERYEVASGGLDALVEGLLSPVYCSENFQWRLELNPRGSSVDFHSAAVTLHMLDKRMLHEHTHTDEGDCVFGHPDQLCCYDGDPHEHIFLNLNGALLLKLVDNPTREPSWSKPAAKEAAAAAAASPDALRLRAEATRQMRSAVVDAIQQGLRYRGRVPLELDTGGEAAAGGM